MSELLSKEKDYIKVFPDRSEIKAFFATKMSAKTGWPFYNEELFKNVGVDDALHVGHWQVHSDVINVVTEDMVSMCKEKSHLLITGNSGEENTFTSETYKKEGILFLESDGAITKEKGVLLTSLHADCIPLFFYDPVEGAIGMVHSGWKGTVQEIGRKCSLKMQEVFGCDPKNMLVHIGPGISKCCFEIDKDVFEQFKNPVYETKGIKYYVDLKKYNQRMLMETGILKENISISGHCTCCEPELFASFRRDGSKLRMGGGICML